MTPMQIATRAHRESDRLISGAYNRTWTDEKTGYQSHKGCSIGCLAYDLGHRAMGGVHAVVAREYFGGEEQIWLAWLQDTIFEGLAGADFEAATDWHVNFANAVAARSRPWADLKNAIWRTLNEHEDEYVYEYEYEYDYEYEHESEKDMEDAIQRVGARINFQALAGLFLGDIDGTRPFLQR